MRLIIEKNDKITGLFIRWLVRRLKEVMKANLDYKKLSALQIYLNEKFPEYKVNIISVLLASINHIKVKEIGLHYLIYFDIDNKKYKNMLVSDILKFINDGNMEIAGCGIISKSLFEIEYNINSLYKEYIYRNGGM